MPRTILAALFLAVLAAGCDNSFPPPDECGGPNADPGLVGTWRSSSSTMTLTADERPMLTIDGGPPVVYAVCSVGGQLEIEAAGVEYPYALQGDTLTIDGDTYTRVQ